MSYREKPLFALVDLALVVGTLVAVKQTLLPVTQLYAGPASTLSAMILASSLLWLRGIRWADLGFRWPDSWIKTLVLAVVTFALMFVAMGAGGAAVDLLFEDIGTGDRFAHVEGNLAAYLIMLGLIWTHAAFFEELLFRAFIISKLSVTLGGGLRADIWAVILAAIFFGYRHYYYQGMNGALAIAIIGLVLGALYLAFGRRNLAPLIIAHGTVDTLGMTFRFLGIED